MTIPNRQFPLVDLHRHLDGNIRPQTIFDLAIQHNHPLANKTLEAVREASQIQDRTSDLVAFIRKIEVGVSVLADLDACRRIAYENVHDAYEEGIDYAELRFSPEFMARAYSLPLEGVVEAVVDGVNSGVSDYGVAVNLIGILSRTFGVEACQSELDALLAYKQSLVAIDLAGDELGFPGKLFTSHFAQVKNAGLHITVHAGEADGSSSIWQAVDELGASRIGHGVAAITDPKLMDRLVQKAVGIESCITSNYQTGTYIDTANHPIKTFLQRGVKVSLNTDDPGVSNITLPHEYQVAQRVVGLSQHQCLQLQQNGLDMAFLSDDEKRRLRDKAASR